MAHGIEDAGCYEPVARGVCQTECLDEVPLCKCVRSSVVRHPGAQQRCLRSCAVELAARLFWVATVQESAKIAVQVLDERRTSMAAAVLAIELVEHLGRRAEPGYVA